MGKCSLIGSCKFKDAAPWIDTGYIKVNCCPDCPYYISADVQELKRKNLSCMDCKYYSEFKDKGQTMIAYCKKHLTSYALFNRQGDFHYELCDDFERRPWWYYEPNSLDPLILIPVVTIISYIVFHFILR